MKKPAETTSRTRRVRLVQIGVIWLLAGLVALVFLPGIDRDALAATRQARRAWAQEWHDREEASDYSDWLAATPDRLCAQALSDLLPFGCMQSYYQRRSLTLNAGLPATNEHVADCLSMLREVSALAESPNLVTHEEDDERATPLLLDLAFFAEKRLSPDERLHAFIALEQLAFAHARGPRGLFFTESLFAESPVRVELALSDRTHPISAEARSALSELVTRFPENRAAIWGFPLYAEAPVAEYAGSSAADQAYLWSLVPPEAPSLRAMTRHPSTYFRQPNVQRFAETEEMRDALGLATSLGFESPRMRRALAGSALEGLVDARRIRERRSEQLEELLAMRLRWRGEVYLLEVAGELAFEDRCPEEGAELHAREGRAVVRDGGENERKLELYLEAGSARPIASISYRCLPSSMPR